MTFNTRCEICDLAWDLGMSEQKFFSEFDQFERAQLLATYRSKKGREFVMQRFPMRKRGK